MSGERFDYSRERQRHEKLVGGAGLLAQLDQLLVDSKPDRWVVTDGRPGMGRSALLAAWLAQRLAVGVVVPHHFIRRGAYGWDDPTKLVGSLVAQIIARAAAMAAKPDPLPLSLPHRRGPQMKKLTILFLAANPPGTQRVALDREARLLAGRRGPPVAHLHRRRWG